MYCTQQHTVRALAHTPAFCLSVVLLRAVTDCSDTEGSDRHTVVLLRAVTDRL